MKILIADQFPENYIAMLESYDHVVKYLPKLNENELPKEIKDNDIVIVRSTKVIKDVFTSATNLKLVIRAGSGVDTIDMTTAKEKNIAVCNCPGKNSTAVAELVFALILGIDRRLYENVSDLRQSKWNKKEYSKADGIWGKTLGILGVGYIGEEVIKRAKAFGLTTVAWSRSLTSSKAMDLGIQKCNDKLELVKMSDIVSVHLANSKDTKNFCDDSFFSNMKERTIFINTSRGDVVDEAALLNAIREKNIRVGLDVYAKEPGANDTQFTNELASHIYGTHHIGASTEQAQKAIAEETVEIIQIFSTQGRFFNRVSV